MKKLLFLLISLCTLLLPMLSFAEVADVTNAADQITSAPATTAEPVKSSGDQINLLWKIPFGSSIDEFYELSTKATGFNFTIEADEDGVPREVSIKDFGSKKGYKIAGYPIEYISTSFYDSSYDDAASKFYPADQSEAYQRAYISWYIDSVAEPEYVTALYGGIVYQMQQQFGAPTSCIFAVMNQSEEIHYCNIALPETYLDFTDVMKAFANQEESIRIKTIFNNIDVQLEAYFYTDYYTDYYIFNVSATFYDEPYDISNLKDYGNQPLYNYDDIADKRRSEGVSF